MKGRRPEGGRDVGREGSVSPRSQVSCIIEDEDRFLSSIIVLFDLIGFSIILVMFEVVLASGMNLRKGMTSWLGTSSLLCL